MVILKNTRKRRFQFTLYHDKVCRRAGRCFCVVAHVVNTAGKRVPQYRPMGVQVDGGKDSVPLPDEVFHVPQVRKGLRPGGFLTRRYLSDNEVKEHEAKVLETEKVRKQAALELARSTTLNEPPEAAPAKPAAKSTKKETR